MEDSNQTRNCIYFLQESNEAIEKFKAIIKPHSNSEQFFNLKSI